MRLFNKKEIISSNLAQKDIVDRLKKTTEFEGDINDSFFKIYPTFDYGRHERLRPEIKGEIFQKKNNSEIHLEFGLTKNMKRILIFSFIWSFALMLVAVIVNYIHPSLFDFPFWDKWWVILIAIIFNLYYYPWFFHSKVKKSLYELEKILKYKKKY